MEKQIVGHPDYYITELGEVISRKGREGTRILLPDISNGYPRVALDGEKYYIADLVAGYFLNPPTTPNCRVFYIDGDKTNCTSSNLAWLTQSEIKRYSQYTVEYRRQILGEW